VTRSEVIKVLGVTLSENVGGTDHSFRNLALVLASEGIQLSLAGPSGDTPTRRWWTESNLEYVPLEIPKRVGLRPTSGEGFNSKYDFFSQVPKSMRAVKALIGKVHSFDVVHSNDLMTHVDVVLAARLAGRPSLLELHDIVPPGGGRLVMSSAVSTANTAVAVSEAVFEQLGPLARRKTRVVHQGVDSVRFSPGVADPSIRAELSADPRALLVAVVGRLDREKGIGELIEALGSLRRSGVDVHLAVVGAPAKNDAAFVDALHTLARASMPGAHRFLSPRNDIPSILRAVDVLACPSHDEPFGLIALEAQASGVPVIASDSGGLRDFVHDNRTGVVFRTGDVDSLTVAAQRLLGDPALCTRIAAEALGRSRDDLSIERRADSFATTYRALLRDAGRRRRISRFDSNGQG